MRDVQKEMLADWRTKDTNAVNIQCLFGVLLCVCVRVCVCVFVCISFHHKLKRNYKLKSSYKLSKNQR